MKSQPNSRANNATDNMTLPAQIDLLRLVYRVMCLAALLALAGLRMPQFLLGAALGWLLVEVNLWLLKVAVVRLAASQGSSLKAVLAKFYLAFGATALTCFLVVRFDLGHPLAFTGALLGLLPALMLVILYCAWRGGEATKQ